MSFLFSYRITNIDLFNPWIGGQTFVRLNSQYKGLICCYSNHHVRIAWEIQKWQYSVFKQSLKQQVRPWSRGFIHQGNTSPTLHSPMNMSITQSLRFFIFWPNQKLYQTSVWFLCWPNEFIQQHPITSWYECNRIIKPENQHNQRPFQFRSIFRFVCPTGKCQSSKMSSETTFFLLIISTNEIRMYLKIYQLKMVAIC